MGKDVVVLDNGASMLKVGFSSDDKPRTFLNMTGTSRRQHQTSFIGRQIEDSPNPASLLYRRPHDRGYIVNFDLQQQIWDYAFGSSCLNIKPKETNFIMTEPPLCPPSLSNAMNEIVFESYQAKSFFKASPAKFALHHYQSQPQAHKIWPSANEASGPLSGDLALYPKEVRSALSSQSIFRINTPKAAHDPLHSFLVLDIGYSFSHAIPFFDGYEINYGIRRCDVGGKVLTNYMKELITFRQYDMSDETILMENVKNRVCVVADDLPQQLTEMKKQGRKSPHLIDYVLPDYVTSKTGYIKGGKDDPTLLPSSSSSSSSSAPFKREQLLRLGGERFSVPELLFRPSDVGIHQGGLAELVVESIKACHPSLHHCLFSNILLVGGSSLFPNLINRLKREIRELAPSEFNVNIITPDNPIIAPWKGAALLASHPNFDMITVTRQEYEELGNDYCQARYGVLI